MEQGGMEQGGMEQGGMEQGGMELLRVQKWAGHRDAKITAERYVHLRPADLRGSLDIVQGSNGRFPASPIFSEVGAIHAALGAPSLQ